MNIQISYEDNRARMDIQGDIDDQGAELLKERLLEVGRRHPQTVELDFGGVGYIGSSGIGKLLLFYKQLTPNGGSLSITRLEPDLFRLFKELKLDTIFSISGKGV